MSMFQRTRSVRPNLATCGLEARIALSSTAVLPAGGALTGALIGTAPSFQAPVNLAPPPKELFPTYPATQSPTFPWLSNRLTADVGSIAMAMLTKQTPSTSAPMGSPMEPPYTGVSGTNIGVMAPVMTALPANNPPPPTPINLADGCAECGDPIERLQEGYRFCEPCWYRINREKVFDGLCVRMLASVDDQVLIDAVKALGDVALRHRLEG